MARPKTTTRSKTKSRVVNRSTRSRKQNSSLASRLWRSVANPKNRVLVFVLLFAAVGGGIFLYRSMAANEALALPGSQTSQDCARATGLRTTEAGSSTKRNAGVCELTAGKTLQPIYFHYGGTISSTQTAYLNVTNSVAGGAGRYFRACYFVNTKNASASFVLRGYAPGTTPSGGQTLTQNTGTEYTKFCDSTVKVAGNTLVSLTVTSGAVRITSVILEPAAPPTAPPPTVGDKTPNCDLSGGRRGYRTTSNTPCIDLSAIPTPNRGRTDRWIVPGGAPRGPGTVESAFRPTCGSTHMNFDDPIVYPGVKGAAHLHQFFGNDSIDYTTTNPLTTGGSTCVGGTVNKTAYWVPAMIDTATGRPITTFEHLDTQVWAFSARWTANRALEVYYKSGHQGLGGARPNFQVFPAGLRMIAGGPNNNPSTGVNRTPGGSRISGFDCRNMGDQQAPQIEGDGSIPYCPPGSKLTMYVQFPQCWDGRNLDSANHMSHMAYGQGWPDRGCPSTHPVILPEIAFLVHWVVPQGSDTRNWRLSSDNYAGSNGGYSAHADWWNGWDTVVNRQWVTNCFNVGLMDCGGGTLGRNLTTGALEELGWNGSQFR